jgi:hypothetical protein
MISDKYNIIKTTDKFNDQCRKDYAISTYKKIYSLVRNINYDSEPHNKLIKSTLITTAWKMFFKIK